MSDQAEATVTEESAPTEAEAQEESLTVEELEAVSGGSGTSQTAPNGQYWATSHTGGGGAYGE